MAAAAQVTPRAWDDEALQLLLPSVEASPWAGVEGVRDNLANTHLWDVRVGAQHALIAVHGLQMQGGRLLEVVGLRSLGDRLTPAAVQALDQLALHYQADMLSMCTRHPHLARTCVRGGWREAGRIVNKITGAH